MEILFGLVVAVVLGLRWVNSDSDTDGPIRFDERTGGFWSDKSSGSWIDFQDNDNSHDSSLLSDSSSSPSFSTSENIDSYSYSETKFFSDAPSSFWPTVNVDGTPMMGDTGIDVHGHAYGVTDSFTSFDHFSSSSDSFSSFGSSDSYTSFDHSSSGSMFSD